MDVLFFPESICIYVLSLSLSVSLMYWGEKYQSKTGVFLSILVLTVLGGFRYGTGTDYFSYERIFYAYTTLGTTDGHFIEPLYLACMSLAARCGLSFAGFVFFIQVLINGIVFVAIWRMKKESGICFPWAVFSLRYYLWGYNAIRQAIAMTFVLLALTYFSKSIFKYLMCVIVAMGFHLTAFIALFLVVCRMFYTRKTKHIWYTLILVCSAGLVLSRVLLVRLLQTLFPSVGYFAYLSMAHGGGSFAGWVFMVVPPLCAIFLVFRKIQRNSIILFLLFVYLLGDVLLLTTLFSSNQLGRIAYYFTMAQIFVLPYACGRITKKYNRRTVVPYTIFVTIFMCIWDYLLLNNGSVMPYQSVFGV